jgi:galactitol-specific phosphotransferase system IIC component
VIWLAGRRTPQIEAAAAAAAERIGLPLEIIDVGLAGLEKELAALLTSTNTAQ